MADNDLLKLKASLDRQHADIIRNPNSVADRKRLLMQLKKMLIANENECMDALLSDMGRPAFEAYSFEMAVLLNEIDFVEKHLRKWAKPAHMRRIKFGYAEVIKKMREPYGSVLILSPWNYPLQLALMPAISAIAAGNRCVIKPSEYAPATSELLKKIISQVFPPEQLTVVTGDAQTASNLTSLPFDLIFFTGSQQTGKAVAGQAAKQLTPTILELGGKNPCIMDQSGYSPEAVREIVWGKFLNAGQTCIAPDTLFVHQSIYEQTLAEISTALTAFYGDSPLYSKDYGRICHPAHFKRVVDFIDEGIVRYGGTHHADDLFVEPTVLTEMQPDSSVMQEEIFGPILPVVPFADLETLFSTQVLQHDALVAYIFSKNKQHMQLFKRHMQSTTISINQVIHHAANPHVAFGGIGNSGHGNYHGKAGFLSCSFEKTNYKAYHYMQVRDKFPPYSIKNMNLLRKFRKWFL